MNTPSGRLRPKPYAMAGISEQLTGGGTYVDVYFTRRHAEQELADIIAERLHLFIEDPESYGDLQTALDSGFEVIEATMREDGTVLVADEEKGLAPPSVRLALAEARSKTIPVPSGT